MPGIVGKISKNLKSSDNERDLHQMINCMMHESFYNSGTYLNQELGAYIGWVSHKNSFSDCMPDYERMFLLAQGHLPSCKE